MVKCRRGALNFLLRLYDNYYLYNSFDNFQPLGKVSKITFGAGRSKNE